MSLHSLGNNFTTEAFLRADIMTSVIRVKRKRDAEPAEALLLARKKMKGDCDNDAVSSEIADVIKIEEKVFHFAGTVEPEIAHSQQVVADKVKEAIVTRNQQKACMKIGARKRKLPKFLPSACSHLPKMKHLKDATIAACQSVLREKCLNFSSDSKFNAQNPKESFLRTSQSQIQDCEKCTIYHNDDHIPRLMDENGTIDEILCNNIKMMREKLSVSQSPQRSKDDDRFVYDLYYCKNTTANWDMSELLYVQPYRYTEQDLVDVSDSEEEYYDDEDDSNDEGNWRNDYPDYDDDSSGSSSSSEDNWERFVQQEEEDMENDDDDLDAGNDDDDDACAQFGMEDTAAFDYNDDMDAEAFDYDPAEEAGGGGGGDNDI